MAELSAKVVEFLLTGTRTGMLGYLAADGRPLVAPVWFVVDDGSWRSTPVVTRRKALPWTVIRESRSVWTTPTRPIPS
jgi:hypothetical protein